MNQVTVTLTLKSKQATESLGRLLEAVEAAVKPDGGYEPIKTCSNNVPLGSSQWVSGERWLAQLGNDSLALTLARIKQQLVKTISEWAAQELRLDPTPAPTLNELETNFRDWFKERYLQPYYGGIALIDATQWGQHLIQQQAATVADLTAPALTSRVMAAPVPVARPFDEWHEDYGLLVLCWRFPIEGPPYVGCPLDSDLDDYYTHWTPLVCPADPTSPADVRP